MLKITYNVRVRRIPVNPVIDNKFLILGNIFCPRRDPIQPLTLLGMNYHLGKMRLMSVILK